MKYVSTGSGRLPLITLIAILSISLTVNLPGLAVSPIMAKLSATFHATELESQLITVLPNLVIIPFILLSGVICNQKNQFIVLVTGLSIFAITGVCCFFAASMVELIVLSCLIGVGCGLIIPLAASLISQHFTGKARVKQLGHKSGISNFIIIIATFYVGWIADINWHLSFIVYMVPVIPLCLVPFMTKKYILSNRKLDNKGVYPPLEEPAVPKPAVKVKSPTGPNFHFSGSQSVKLLLGIIGVYVAMTYATMVVSYYLPFTMGNYHLGTGDVGTATAIYFAAATLAGFLLTPYIKRFGPATIPVSIGLVAFGLFITGFFHFYWTYIVGIFILGFGYGIIQPVIYDKTTYISPNAASSTKYFAYVLTANYVAISIVPFIIEFAERMFDSRNPSFSFIFNGFFCVLMLIVALIYRRSFVMRVEPKLYSK